jgi:hypothetical protein
LEHCGFKAGTPAIEAVEDIVNREVMAHIKHVVLPDGRVFPEVDDTWSADLLGKTPRRRQVGR